MKDSAELEIRELPSEHFDKRAEGSRIDTVVVHSMWCPSAPEARRFSAESCKTLLDECKVSAHFLLDREGIAWQCVPESERAWHAGVSKLPFPDDSRESVNHFSIGIELMASEDSGYTECQLRSLSVLIADLCARHPVRFIVGHLHIAPGRKTDPWNFDWQALEADMRTRCPGRTLRFPI